MKGTITVTLEFTEGCKTSVEWHGDPGSSFTSKGEVDLFEKVLRGLANNLDKLQRVPDPRCRDCKYWCKGKATINAYRDSMVCLKQRKTILHPKFNDQVIYFVKNRMCKACELFESKEV